MERSDQMFWVFVFKILIWPFEVDSNLDDLTGIVRENDSVFLGVQAD